MGSAKGRVYGDWSGSYEGWLLRDIIQIYYHQGYRKDILAEKLHQHVSREIIQEITGRDMNANSIDQRGHKGIFSKNVFEHPDKHPMGIKMMPDALKIVIEKRFSLTRAEINTMVEDALKITQSISINKTIVDDKGIKAGLIYVNSTGSGNCNFGMTTKKNAQDRIEAFRKGDIDGKMQLKHVMWLPNAKKIDTLLKQYFRCDHEGHEVYSVSADTVWERLNKIAKQEQVGGYPVVENGKELSKIEKIQEAAE